MKKETKYTIGLTTLYFAVALLGILHHEFFIDEAHHWLLARDSDSIAKLVDNTRMEGHPLLWSLLLYGISRLTSDPISMQLLQVLISTATIFLFLRKAPFAWVFKALFIFGYFMIFEYNLFSRNYMLGILFLFAACSFFKDRSRNFTLICMFLALASNVHLMFSVIAFALFLTLLLENWINHNLIRREYFIGYLIFIVGIGSILIQIQHTQSDWLLEPIRQMPTSERLVKGIGSLFKGLINVPDFRMLHFWNSNIIVNASRPVVAFLAIIIYLLPFALFYKSRKMLFFVYVALIGTQLFFFVTQRAAIRFQGITFLIVFIALWIEHFYKPEHYHFSNRLDKIKIFLIKKPVVYGILLIQLFSGIYAYTMDWRYPFTSAKETVDFLKREKLDTREIVSVTCDGTIISAYLERKIWFLCDGGYQSFCHWDSGCTGRVTSAESLVMLSEFMKTHEDVIYVSYYPLARTGDGKWHAMNDWAKFRFLKKFDVNLVDKSYYYIFEVSKK